MAGAAPAGGAVPVPPPALVAPAVAHGFARCNIPGADNTLDYLSTPAGAKLVFAFPNLGWIDVPGAPGFKAAPALSIQGVTCCAAFGDWTGPVLAPQLLLSELTTCFSLAYMSRAADALASLGLLDKTFTRDKAFLDDWEVAMPRVPSPSPFEVGANELVVPSPFLQGGAPAVPAQAAVPAVPAQAAVPAVRANRAAGVAPRAAIPARPAQPSPTRPHPVVCMWDRGVPPTEPRSRRVA